LTYCTNFRRLDARALVFDRFYRGLPSFDANPEDADTVRYFLLESLRLFAQDRLAERCTERIDEPARLARRHCYYYRDKVLQPPLGWFGPAEQQLLTWVSGAWSNIRRAVDTSMAAGMPVVGLLICVGLQSLRALVVIGSLSEIRGRLDQTLAATEASEP
jgi:hypothetical protein